MSPFDFQSKNLFASKPLHTSKKLIAVGIAALVLAACSTPPKKPEGADNVRSKLMQLQSNSQLASLAPVAIKDAEVAVAAAEQPQKDVELGKHLVWIADRKVDIAAARAQARLLEDQRKALSEQRETARLDSRTLEADKALAALAALNAKNTERGIVITLGDVLFDTGRAELKSGASNNLSKLAEVLNEYPKRTVAIEGHTDSVGSEEYNVSLSLRRADAVKSYLVSQGVDALRITSAGMGEDTPVADNNTAAGRQQNRRVEVIISNTSVPAQ